jgi:hypothetical protein
MYTSLLRKPFNQHRMTACCTVPITVFADNVHRQKKNNYSNIDFSGYMMFLLVNLLLQSEYVAMTMDLSLQQKDFCLTFWYRTRTEATFKVNLNVFISLVFHLPQKHIM